MTPKQIELVQKTFKQLAEQADETAANFYEHLFRLEPELRPLFTNNMHHQGQKLMAALAIFIFSLDEPGDVPPMLRRLGARHSHHGIPASAYATAQQALMATLEDRLGSQFTPDAQVAWMALFSHLAEAMTSTVEVL